MKGRIMFGPYRVFAAALLLVIASAPYAKHYVETRSCGKHLAVISQAARVWANAHNDGLPSGFIIMSNELVTPRLLICPGDKIREPADNWQAFTSANSSYQVLEEASRAKDLPPEILQNLHYLQCKVHGGNYANALGEVSVYRRPIPILFLAGLAIVAFLGRSLWHRFKHARGQLPGSTAAGDLLPRIQQVRHGLAACGRAPSPSYRKGLLEAARRAVRALAFFAERKGDPRDSTTNTQHNSPSEERRIRRG
jgi:hypothetical protein